MTITDLNNVFQYLTLGLLFVNVELYLRSHNLFSKVMAYNLLIIYIILNLINSLTIEYLYHERIENLYLSNFYLIFQFILFTYFYLHLFKNKKQKIYVKASFIIVILILMIQYILTPLSFFYFNLLEVLLTSFPLITYSIIHLYNSLVTEGKFLYINAAILIYLTASTLIFILGNYIRGIDRELARGIWLILKILYSIFLILLTLEWKNSFSSHKMKVQ
ncbi:hypothetical protein SAMN06265376_108171 [Dokdonia pacifica]|uniref:YhhN-like protein n=1 Tax=Dokdonia pacifica TaxID=1627892 RepID=A0A239CTR5_9FLAO|nr:hypothetical protein SAMN06265376_108171 [Dokdonia pacifica]